MRNRALILGLAVLGSLFLVACDEESPSAQQSESASQQSSYTELVKNQPAHSMSYSSTRDTINFWIDTWGEEGKLSYVYLIDGGVPWGYYVFKGLPVNMCAALTPTYRLIGTPNDGSSALDQLVPAPSIDGAYYSGGQCNSSYGRDATTDTYIEVQAGVGTTVVIREEPLPVSGLLPLGDTTVPENR